MTVGEMAELLNKAVEQGLGNTPLVVSECRGITGLYAKIDNLLLNAEAHQLDGQGFIEEHKTAVVVVETRGTGYSTYQTKSGRII